MNRRFGRRLWLYPLSLSLLSGSVQAQYPPTLPHVARAQQAEGEPGAAPSAEGIVIARVRATVNGSPILDEELREVVWQALRATEQLPEPKRSAEQKQILREGLDQLIEREVIIADAEERLQKRDRVLAQLREVAEKDFDKQLRSMQQRSGAESEEELRAILAQQGVSLANLKRRAERQFISNEYMRSRIYPEIEKIGHREIRQYFDEHPGEFTIEDRLKWQDIFIDAGAPQFTSRAHARQHAEQVAQQVRAGADFARLADDHDMGDSKYRAGVGLGQKRGEIRPVEVEDTLFKLEEGQVALVELPSGYHIIRVDKREFAGLQPFDDATQKDIRRKLQTIIADREYKRIVNDLKRKATIQIFLND